MRIVALSDIHSNHIALKACMDEIEKEPVDAIMFLGDYVSDCPNPNATLELLEQIKSKYKTYFIRGNREEYFLDYADHNFENWSYTSYKGSLLYTYELLDKRTLSWFDSLPSTIIVTLEGTKPIILAHGSPSNTRELLDKECENTKNCLNQMESEYILCGHTHRQCIYQYNNKTLFNPGSVGVAIGVKKQAHYMVLEWKNDEWVAEGRSVSYDFEQVKEEFLNSELMEKGKVWPLAIIRSLETGVDYGPLCAKRAYDLAIAEGEQVHDRVVDEKYWRIAAKEYGVIE